jgi:hypothetical protein
MDINYRQVHSESGWHEDAIGQSKKCGCFYCMAIFDPSEIEEWVEESSDGPRGTGKTALCPYCGIDAVLPESSLYSLTPELLKAMHEKYF